MASKAYAAIKRLLGYLSGGFLAILMAVTVVDVIGRYVLNAPLLGAYELSEISIAMVVACAMPLVTLEASHIALTLMDKRLGRTGAKLRDAVAAGLLAVGFAALAWRLVVELISASRIGEKSELLGIPRAPILGLIAAMFALSALASVFQAVARNRGEAPQRAARPNDKTPPR